MIEVLFKKLFDDVVIPQYAHDGDSGFDIVVHNFKKLYSAQAIDANGEQVNNETFQDKLLDTLDEITLSPHSRLLVGSGYAIAIKPDSYELQIRSRSGLALKQGLVVLNSPGTVDNQYRGEIGAILCNLSAFHIKIKKGDKVAQGVFMIVSRGKFIEVPELEGTNRGSGGYGSTDDKFKDWKVPEILKDPKKDY